MMTIIIVCKRGRKKRKKSHLLEDYVVHEIHVQKINDNTRT